jgi:hypothetical protein
MAKEIERGVGSQIRVLNAAHLPIIYATDSKTDKTDAANLRFDETGTPADG